MTDDIWNMILGSRQQIELFICCLFPLSWDAYIKGNAIGFRAGILVFRIDRFATQPKKRRKNNASLHEKAEAPNTTTH